MNTLPFLALILTAATSSLLGVFVLWKKLSYFGDAISHSILLGAALGVILNLNPDFSLIFFAVIFALLVGFLAQNRYFSKDTIITISSYFCIALAIVANDLAGKNFDFSNYIFGDIASVASLDITILMAILAAVIFFTIFAFKKILLINLAGDLAKIEGIKIELWNGLFLILLTLTIAMSVRVVGVLLVTALLVLPAAIARLFASSALQMLLLSAVSAIMVCGLSGLAAEHYHISAGALSVLVLSLIFMFGLTVKK
jgi:zinc transport system permease protein